MTYLGQGSTLKPVKVKFVDVNKKPLKGYVVSAMDSSTAEVIGQAASGADGVAVLAPSKAPEGYLLLNPVIGPTSKVEPLQIAYDYSTVSATPVEFVVTSKTAAILTPAARQVTEKRNYMPLYIGAAIVGGGLLLLIASRALMGRGQSAGGMAGLGRTHRTRRRR